MLNAVASHLYTAMQNETPENQRCHVMLLSLNTNTPYIALARTRTRRSSHALRIDESKYWTRTDIFINFDSYIYIVTLKQFATGLTKTEQFFSLTNSTRYHRAQETMI